MFSLQVTMFIFCSHISFSQTWAFMSCLLVCFLLNVAFFFSFFWQQFIFIPWNWSSKGRKYVRACETSQNLTSVLCVSEVLFYLNAFFLTLHIHCFASYCCCAASCSVLGLKFFLRGLLCFWPIATPPPPPCPSLPHLHAHIFPLFSFYPNVPHSHPLFLIRSVHGAPLL